MEKLKRKGKGAMVLPRDEHGDVDWLKMPQPPTSVLEANGIDRVKRASKVLARAMSKRERVLTQLSKQGTSVKALRLGGMGSGVAVAAVAAAAWRSRSREGRRRNLNQGLDGGGGGGAGLSLVHGRHASASSPIRSGGGDSQGRGGLSTIGEAGEEAWGQTRGWSNHSHSDGDGDGSFRVRVSNDDTGAGLQRSQLRMFCPGRRDASSSEEEVDELEFASVSGDESVEGMTSGGGALEALGSNTSRRPLQQHRQRHLQSRELGQGQREEQQVRGLPGGGATEKPLPSWTRGNGNGRVDENGEFEIPRVRFNGGRFHGDGGGSGGGGGGGALSLVHDRHVSASPPIRSGGGSGGGEMRSRHRNGPQPAAPSNAARRSASAVGRKVIGSHLGGAPDLGAQITAWTADGMSAADGVLRVRQPGKPWVLHDP